MAIDLEGMVGASTYTDGGGLEITQRGIEVDGTQVGQVGRRWHLDVGQGVMGVMLAGDDHKLTLGLGT